MTAEMWPLSHLHYRNVLANESQHLFMYVKSGYVQSFITTEEIAAAFEVGKAMLEQSFLQKYLQESQVVRNGYQQLYKKVKSLQLGSLSSHQLAEYLREYQRLFEHVYALFKITQPEYPAAAVQQLRELLQQYVKNDQVEEAFIALTTPTEIDMIKQEEIDAYQLSLKPTISESDLLEYAEKYPWFFFNTYNRKTIRAFLQARFDDLQNISIAERKQFIVRAYESVEQQRRTYTAWLKRVKNDPQITYLSSLFGKLANDRLELKKWWVGTEYLFLEFFEEIAKRLSVSVDDFFMGYRIDEIYQALEQGEKLPYDLVQSRKRLYVCVLDGETLRFLEEKDAQQFYDQHVKAPQTASRQLTEVRGMIANTGKVTGVARIIRVEDLSELLKDMERFKEGEIIVTTMTQPTMAGLARKAAAIVTNEGGITSHAAILAREFGIPCIVGTKTATELIRDGDRIEVDAEKGIVKRLN